MARSRPPERPPADWHARLPAILAEVGVALGEPALSVLRTHFDLLLHWNSKINLTAIRDPEQILRRHFAESLFLTKVVPFGPGVLYDVGSGAGFPGLPLKAAHPELGLVLVESSQKKAAFLKEVIRQAAIRGARVEMARIEVVTGTAGQERPDWITMRAVGRVKALLPDLRRLLAPAGQVALFLGGADVGRAAAVAGFDWQEPVPVPGSERRVILVGRSRAG